MSFSQFMAILRARWLIPVAVLAVMLALAFAANQLLPKKYTASGSVMVDMRSPDPINGTLAPVAGLYLQTQMDVIRSERVSLMVVRALKLNENAELRERWRASGREGRGSLETWVSQLILEGLEVTPARGSSVIEVSYTAADPDFAAVVANRFINAYLDTSVELRVQPAKQFTHMFNEQLEQAKGRLEAAQRKLSGFQQEKGIVATDERLDVETARLGELSAQLVSVQAQAADARSRRARSGMDSPDSHNNSVIMSLRGDLARQEARLQEAADRLGDNHPQISQMRAGIEEIRRKIVSESASVGRTAGVALEIAEQREAQARGALEAQRQKVLRLKAIRDEAQLLANDVASAQRSVEAIQLRSHQTRLESETDQTNVAVLKVATPPSSPSSPRTLLLVLQAVFIGIFVGIGAAVWTELRHRRIRVDEDLGELVGAELVGHMPRAKSRSGRLPIRFAPQLPSRASLRLPFVGQ